MDFRKWQEEQRKQVEVNETSSPLNDNFFGRTNELVELKEFVEDNHKKVFCLYGVPMIGKSTLVKEFCKIVTNYKTTTIKFSNPENPEITLEKAFSNFDWSQNDQQLIIIENFEEALLLKGDQEHMHEVKFPGVLDFLKGFSRFQNVKLILESRFQIRNNFLTGNIISELSTKQLGKIERTELYQALNEIYRHNRVQYDAFEEVCEKLNDHVWLIELAMQNDWLFEDVREAAQHPESLTQKLWDKIQSIIRKLPMQHRTLLCAFGIINPITEDDIKTNLGSHPEFSKKNELNSALWSLRKKLLLVYDSKIKSYELNPFLREVCFTYLQGQKEMQIIEQIPFFTNTQRPKYNSILQAHEKGDYSAFFRLLKEKRKNKEYDTVHDVLKEAYWTNPKPEVILNEIGVTYKWQKNYPKAIEIFEELIEKYNHVSAYNELGIVYKEQKNYPKAIEYLEKACKSGNIHSYNELAIVYKEQKNYPKAIEYLEKACELGNIHSYNELAIVYQEQKNYPKAIEVLENALKINEKDIKILNELANAYKELEDFERALKIVNKGLEIAPNDRFFRDTLKNIISSKNDFEKKSVKTSLIEIKQKILFISANPNKKSKMQTDTEYRIIKAEIKRGSHRDVFEFLQPQFAATITELIRAMNEMPNIIHFSGHGNTDGIIISTDNNQSQVLPIAAMERLFKPLQGVTKIIILNSCYSVEQARLISKYGMYVIGNNLPIGHKAAIDFSKGLYNGLSEGKDLKSAFNDALIVVITESPQYAHVIEVWKDGYKMEF